jgi:anti-sigma B factor antagonist
MSDGVEPSAGDGLHIETKYHGTEAIITVEGEFDLSATAPFWTHVTEALEAQPGSIVIHVRDLTFIDSSGLMALVRARDAAVEAGVAFRVREPSPALRRIAELAGVEDLLRD